MNRNNSVQHELLEPIYSVTGRSEYEQLLKGDLIKQVDQIATQILKNVEAESFIVNGFCIPCNENVHFLVDMQWGGRRFDNTWMPNWRERLECPSCGMNNRQRLVATLLKQALSGKHQQKIYLMEQVTPIFRWAENTFKQHLIIGSEYLGHNYQKGTEVSGIRHEDIESLSFFDQEFDLIISNDVFEHVPNPAEAFKECARVLKVGGTLLATIPFHVDMDFSVSRAQLVNNQLIINLPPEYHGNPVSSKGSLVFTDFGWDLLETMRLAGFSEVAVDVYASREFGHYGGGQLVFRLKKS